MSTTPEFGIDHLTVVPREPRPDGDAAGPAPEAGADDAADASGPDP